MINFPGPVKRAPMLGGGLVDVVVGSNPRCTLAAFEDLGESHRAVFGSLVDDPTLYGALIDDRGGVKVVDRASADLFAALMDGPRASSELELEPIEVARLILDGVLEAMDGSGRFVSGSLAVGIVLDDSWTPPPPATTTARLSQAALQYGQMLDVDDAVSLSSRLYFYGRIPASPSWLARLSSPDAVARFLGVDGRLARRLRRSWWSVPPAPTNDGWFVWSRRGGMNGQRGSDRCKLYVSPVPAAVPDAFAATVDVAEEEGAVAMKVGNDGAALLRPDKIVVYFSSFERLRAAGSRLGRLLSGCRGQGVPFTAELADSDGVLSWGVDPPRSEQLLEWRERESWRLWLTNRLAVALLGARRDGGPLEPWRYSMARIGLEGVDLATWAPDPGPWEGQP